MMKASELRIGNYLQAPLGEIMRVAQIGHEANPDFIFCKGDDGSFGQNGFEPIPLTEEWLVRFGFEKSTTGWFTMSIGSITIYVDPTAKAAIFSSIVLTNFEHIHRLQNLIFDLTGEELTTTPIQ